MKPRSESTRKALNAATKKRLLERVAHWFDHRADWARYGSESPGGGREYRFIIMVPKPEENDGLEPELLVVARGYSGSWDKV